MNIKYIFSSAMGVTTAGHCTGINQITHGFIHQFKLILSILGEQLDSRTMAA